MTPQNALRTLERELPAEKQTDDVREAFRVLWDLVILGKS